MIYFKILPKSNIRESMYRLFSIQKSSYSNIRGHLRSMATTPFTYPSQQPVESSIRLKLTNALNPSFIQIHNESHMHNVPKGSETHFKVIVVSEKFNDQPLIKRHRMVNDLLQNELQNSVHALSIVAKTPAQWEESSKEIEASPACRGGFGK